MLLAAPQLWAESDLFDGIEVNGLTDNKAILFYQGNLFLLKEGESAEDIRLIEANNRYAVVERQGIQRRLFLREADASDYSDNFIASSDQLTREQSGILASRILANADSHIIEAKEYSREEDRVRFRIEYFYNASHGEKASLRASVYHEGSPVGQSVSTYTRIYPGRNTADIEVRMSDAAPQNFTSDALQFEIVGSEAIDGVYRVLNKRIPYEKHWQRPEKKPEKFIGNVEWKTSSQ